MAKIFETDQEIVEMVNKAFDDAELTNYGLNLKVLSLSKAKDVIKVNKASATTEFLAKKDSMITVFIYEAAFDRLDLDSKKMLIDMAISNVSVNLETGRISVESNPFVQIFNMRRKYGDAFLNALEYSYASIQQIEEENAEQKRLERENKKKNKTK